MKKKQQEKEKVPDSILEVALLMKKATEKLKKQLKIK